jgi:hypothetical protein
MAFPFYNHAWIFSQQSQKYEKWHNALFKDLHFHSEMFSSWSAQKFSLCHYHFHLFLNSCAQTECSRRPHHSWSMLVITNGFSRWFEVRKYSGFPIWGQEALPYTLGHGSFGLAWRSDVYIKLSSESVTTVICPKLMLKSEIWFQCSDGEMWWDCWPLSRSWISLPFNKLMQS